MATAKQQADLNKQLNTTAELQAGIKDSLEKQGGLAGKFSKDLKDIGARTTAILDREIQLEQTTGKKARTSKTLVSQLKHNVDNMDKIVTGEMESFNLIELRNQAVKEGNTFMVEQIDLADKLGNRAEFFGNAFKKATGAVDSIGQKIEQSSFGFIKTGKATARLKSNMKDVATGKSGIGTLFKGTKLLRIGLAGAAIAAASFALEANKLQKDLGLAYGESAKILATSKSIAMVNKANGMTQEETLAIMKNIASEFGSFDDATAGATLKASNLVANYGMATDSVGTLARQMQAVGAHSLDSALNSIELQANMARAAGVPVGEVMNDVAKSTGFFAAYAKDGGTNIVAAAISAKKLGLEMASIASIADSLLDFEDSITKQMEAEVLLGRELNLEKAREMIFNNDIAGAIAEVSKLVSPEEFARMDAVRRKSLAAAVGIDVATFSKAISGNVEDAVIDPSGRIISTAPEDYLIATKDPSMLGAATAAAGAAPQFEVGGLEAKLDTLIRATTDGQDGIKRSVQQMGVS